MILLEVMHEVPYDENLLAHQEPLYPISEWQDGEWDGHEEREARLQAYSDWRTRNPVQLGAFTPEGDLMRRENAARLLTGWGFTL